MLGFRPLPEISESNLWKHICKENHIVKNTRSGVRLPLFWNKEQFNESLWCTWTVARSYWNVKCINFHNIGDRCFYTIKDNETQGDIPG